ncbi:tRNA epoxyqueuosine(34) reductase QueG [Ahrensia kielensis]|uniref:tRNA epoxyqueuosine(34) reductase QueG n=1 Tax=Ahrensia kielensis TaxID=76980 RepID=A0ABU9T6X3_9HYPH
MSTVLSPEKAKSALIKDLSSEGFELVGVMDAEDTGNMGEALSEFIDADYFGSMQWMKETQERRSAPKNLWEDARTVVLAAMVYSPDNDYNPLQAIKRDDRGTISCYAHNRDYHDVIKGKLKQVAGRFVAKTGAEVKVFIDTAPVMEKPLAQKAGLGWQGKHTNLVSREIGSWFFIGSIFTDMALPVDEAETDHCGSCRSCLDSCPTNAFPSPYHLDARRCISYLTIEHAGPIDIEFRKPMGNRIYGCDDCLAVCPWNKFAAEAREAKLQARDDLKSPPLANLLQLNDADFRKMFAGSPVKRIGRNRFIRNCLIAAGNSSDKNIVQITKPHLRDPDAVVRGAAVWALAQQLSRDDLCVLYETHHPKENDASVRREWTAALESTGLELE